MHKEQQIAQISLIAELHSKIHKEEVARTAEFTLLRKVMTTIKNYFSNYFRKLPTLEKRWKAL